LLPTHRFQHKPTAIPGIGSPHCHPEPFGCAQGRLRRCRGQRRSRGIFSCKAADCRSKQLPVAVDRFASRGPVGSMGSPAQGLTRSGAHPLRGSPAQGLTRCFAASPRNSALCCFPTQLRPETAHCAVSQRSFAQKQRTVLFPSPLDCRPVLAENAVRFPGARVPWACRPVLAENAVRFRALGFRGPVGPSSLKTRCVFRALGPKDFSAALGMTVRCGASPRSWQQGGDEMRGVPHGMTVRCGASPRSLSCVQPKGSE
jgi:hypothetical protein